jgi:hypothetical protein
VTTSPMKRVALVTFAVHCHQLYNVRYDFYVCVESLCPLLSFVESVIMKTNVLLINVTVCSMNQQRGKWMKANKHKRYTCDVAKFFTLHTSILFRLVGLFRFSLRGRVTNQYVQESPALTLRNSIFPHQCK